MIEHKADTALKDDVVDLLIQQHMLIRDLFREVEVATGSSRREAFERLVRLLAVHETAEEEVVHPLARSAMDGGEDVVDARLEEERQAKQLLAQLEEMGPDATEFPSLLEQLRGSVLMHAHHEEAYEFRYLRQQCDPNELRALAGMVKAAEAVAPTHPHPGVESAAKNIVMGPVTALFDRTKDLVRDAMSRARS
jgi:Hemerythrin HHE cation binding domain